MSSTRRDRRSRSSFPGDIEFKGLKAARADGAEGWALLHSVSRALLIFIALWQLVMLYATFATLQERGIGLATAVALLGVAALAALKYRWIIPALPVGMAALGLWAYVASEAVDSTLAMAATWQNNFSMLLAGALLIGRLGVVASVAITLALGAAIAWLVPDWGPPIALSTVVALLSILAVMRFGMARLFEVAADADAAAERTGEAQRRARLAERVSAQMAEEARILHDTAINTLSAVANGGAGTAHGDRVRAQCARDVALLETLRVDPSLMAGSSLGSIFDQPGLPVTRRGMDDDDTASCEQALPGPTITAIVGCVREAMTNATKHSGADRVEIDASRSDDTLTVVIRDDGTGFSGTSETFGDGITHSILGRARANDFRAAVQSSPGEGTSVTLTVPLAPERPPGPSSERTPAQGSPIPEMGWRSDTALHQRAGELWAFGATVVSIILTAIDGEGRYSALLPMISVMLLASVAYRFMPAGRQHPVFVVALSVTTGIVFTLSAAAAGFGAGDPIHWQAFAPTGPFILLLTLSAGWRFRVVAALPWVVSISVVGGMIHSTSTTASQIVLVAGAIGLGFSALWAVFQSLLYRLGEHAAESARQEHEALLRTALVEATQQSNRRWAAAGLESAIRLLRAIAEGRRDLHAEHTRADCETEERYLRQITQLSPHLVSLSRVLPETLSHARRLGVNYFLQVGDSDAPDDSSAQGISEEIRSIMSGVGPGHDLRVSIYPVTEGLRLTLATSPSRSAPQSMRGEQAGGVHLVERTYPRDSLKAPVHAPGPRKEDPCPVK